MGDKQFVDDKINISWITTFFTLDDGAVLDLQASFLALAVMVDKRDGRLAFMGRWTWTWIWPELKDPFDLDDDIYSDTPWDQPLQWSRRVDGGNVSSGDKISSQALTLLRDLDNKQFHRFVLYVSGCNYLHCKNFQDKENQLRQIWTSPSCKITRK